MPRSHLRRLSLWLMLPLAACTPVKMVPGAYSRDQLESIAFTRDVIGTVTLTYEPVMESAAYSPGLQVKRHGGNIYVTIRRCYATLPCQTPDIAVSRDTMGPYRLTLATDARDDRIYLRDNGEWEELVESVE